MPKISEQLPNLTVSDVVSYLCSRPCAQDFKVFKANFENLNRPDGFSRRSSGCESLQLFRG